MTGFHLAEINIARMRAPLITDLIMKDFVDQLDTINALAESSPGFVWRLKSDSGNATDILIYEDPRIIINMSVWESIDALFSYAYFTDHTDAFRRRGEWFERMTTPHMALWWVPVGTLPTAEEGKQRLDHLTQHGPTEYAFTFKHRFPIPNALPR
jgi:hypothetical protein